MSRVIEYELREGGWATIAIALGGRRYAFPASCLHDTFRELCEGVLALGQGRAAAHWVVFCEPDAIRIEAEQRDGATVLSIDKYASLGTALRRAGASERLCSGETTLRALVSDVVVSASRMLEAHRADGYLAAWRSAFPTAAVEALKEHRRSMPS